MPTARNSSIPARIAPGRCFLLYAQIAGSLILFNFTASMLFVFGVAGMALAAMGTYGLVSYTVKQSTHEIGIRIALGAPRLSVVIRFLTRGVRLGAIGAGIGVIAALVLTATLIPSWRAARTDPLIATGSIARSEGERLRRAGKEYIRPSRAREASEGEPASPKQRSCEGGEQGVDGLRLKP